MRADKVDYEHFMSPPLKNIAINAIADTGCQSCLAGLSLVERLGLSSRDLIPVVMQMHSVDNHNIPVLGAAILRLSGVDYLGNERAT